MACCLFRVPSHYLYQCLLSIWFNSLAPGRSECDSKTGIFNLVLLIGIFRSPHDHALRWMPQDLTDDKSTLVQVMAWCRQATSHYLSQCWLSPLSPNGVARPQWVNDIPVQEYFHVDNVPPICRKKTMFFCFPFISNITKVSCGTIQSLEWTSTT